MVVNPSMYAKLPYDTLNDLVPITVVSVSPFALVAPINSPFSHLNDVLSALRAKPGSMSFGVSDSSAMLPGPCFNIMDKVDIQPIPYT